jgi:hypothetical protein
MYVPVPDIVTHAQRKLITLIERRQFSGVARSYGIRASNIPSLYRMAIGKIAPSFVMMFNLRHYIAPVEWCYDETEGLPERRKFKPKYAYFDRRARQRLIRYPTAAVAYLEDIYLKGGLQGFCGEQGLGYATVYGYAVKRKRHDGVLGYHARPGHRVIRKLRGVIHPDDWFIFPEEISHGVPGGTPC